MDVRWQEFERENTGVTTRIGTTTLNHQSHRDHSVLKPE